jgi:hypothetical protein
MLIIIIVLLFSMFYFVSSTKKENYANKYTAVIIEPRQHKALYFVLKNFSENLSDEWNIIIMHGNNNLEFINNILDTELSKYKERIHLDNLNIDNLTIQDYNRLLFTEEFYKKIPTEIFLIFQTDSMICPTEKDKINDFLKFDYVGAPWASGDVGNGGFSLRKKSKMLSKIRNCVKNGEDSGDLNEDGFFSDDKCEPLSKPEFEAAKLFSNETVYSEYSFGVHKPWPYLSKEDMVKKIEKCDGLETLVELNK